MQRLFSMFPNAGPGIGLVLLRCSVAVALVAPPATPWFAWALAAPIAIGLATPILAAVVVAVHAWRLLTVTTPETTAVTDCALAAALALLGPGAYSLDARRFGRRLVVTGQDTAE